MCLLGLCKKVALTHGMVPSENGQIPELELKVHPVSVDGYGLHESLPQSVLDVFCDVWGRPWPAVVDFSLHTVYSSQGSRHVWLLVGDSWNCLAQGEALFASAGVG